MGDGLGVGGCLCCVWEGGRNVSVRGVCLYVSIPDVYRASMYVGFQCALQVMSGGWVYAWSDVAESDLWG